MPTQKPSSPHQSHNASRRKKSKAKKERSHNVDRNLLSRMEACPNAETLNEQVIAPFVRALVNVCDARGYVFNIYGDHCNLVITPETHAESLYRLIDSYLDEAGL